MYRAFKIQIGTDHKLYSYCDEMCFKAKNLYNITNYYIRQVYTLLKNDTKNENQLQALTDVKSNLPKMNEIREKNYQKALKKPRKTNKKGEVIEPKLSLFTLPTKEKSFIYYEFMEAMFKVMKQVDYKSMPSQSNQQTMKKVFEDWKSFFEANKKYKVNPEGFTGKPKIPRYKKKSGRTTCYLTNQIVKLKGNSLKLPQTDVCLSLGDIAKTEGKLQQVRIVPAYGIYTIEVIFKLPKNDKMIVRNDDNKNEFLFSPKFVMGIDIGVDNLATIVDNIGSKPVLIKGKWLKSVNQYYNKLRSDYIGILRNGLQKDEGQYTSKRLLNLDRKREYRVTDFLHKASAEVVKIAVDRKIDTIIVGKNVGWKQQVDMRKNDKQTFIQIPFGRFIEMIRYKAERLGIQVVDREESYTSKASFLGNDTIPTYGKEHNVTFSGYRETRAFYKVKESKIRIHADVNGAYNIIRKHVDHAFKGLNKKVFLQSPKSRHVIKHVKKSKAKLKASA